MCVHSKSPRANNALPLRLSTSSNSIFPSYFKPVFRTGQCQKISKKCWIWRSQKTHCSLFDKFKLWILDFKIKCFKMVSNCCASFLKKALVRAEQSTNQFFFSKCKKLDFIRLGLCRSFLGLRTTRATIRNSKVKGLLRYKSFCCRLFEGTQIYNFKHFDQKSS